MKKLLYSIGFSFFICLFSFLFFTVKGYCQEEGYTKESELIDRINQAFQRASIFDAYVQYDEKNKLFELKGKFRNYDEFLYAYMIAQVYAGVSKVSPAYSIKHAVIIHTPIEMCLPYVVMGKECPYWKKETKKGPITKEKKEVVSGPDKYALVIGVSRFSSPINPVPGADSDAKIWGKYLESRGFKVTYLINENATKTKVKEALWDITSNLKDGDVFILFASSHGAPKNVDGEVGILLYDSGNLSQNRKINFYVPPSEPHLQAAEKMVVLVKDSLSLREDVLSLLIVQNYIG